MVTKTSLVLFSLISLFARLGARVVLWIRDKVEECKHRGGPRNSSGGGGGVGAGIIQMGVGGRVQVHGNFHILTSQKKQKSNPPPGSAPETCLF